MAMNEHVLCVDDEPAVLTGLVRNLGKRFVLHTEGSGKAGLDRIASDGPYAVVVSDMRMPGMDGIAFLSEVSRIAPDTTRMMLTGNADQETARAAINEGQIFRFLTKPCDPEQLAQSLTAAIDYHRRITVERELLEDTLRGAVKVLTEVLGLVNPTAFGRASQLARCVQHMTATLGLPDAWRFEVAAMLSQLGCVTVLPETLDAVQAGQDVSDAERERLAAHASVARDLLCHIPRLETVAEMIVRQDEAVVEEATEPISARDPVSLGAQLLRVAKIFDSELSRGASSEQARAKLRAPGQECDPLLVAALDDYQPEGGAKVLKTVNPRRLAAGMVLAEPLSTTAGVLLVHSGQEVSIALRARLEEFSRSGQLAEAVRVWVPGS